MSNADSLSLEKDLTDIEVLENYENSNQQIISEKEEQISEEAEENSTVNYEWGTSVKFFWRPWRLDKDNPIKKEISRIWKSWFKKTKNK
ncbi:hypothetical protein [Mycoplasma suis]|uniref:Uncharacterized protein n=1 Tax=Mycoplasma suis (strain Illinois) TaxID=768700 RepID=F0QRK0_MYCSL|nr:hypothetical protein [Mycoplasma suis]ADX98120.1 hypothetical protein MSU_0588 [Mycoplasma suis str. Illinois]